MIFIIHGILIISVTTPSNIKITAQLAHRIWNQHYVPIIGQAQVDYMLQTIQSKVAIQKQINKGYEYFLLWHHQKPSAYLALVVNASESKLMISKIYVDVAVRGRQLGSKLIEFAEEQAKNKNLNTLWLTVNKDNTKSIAWYQKHGFEIKEKVQFDIGQGFVMDDYLMEKNLV